MLALLAVGLVAAVAPSTKEFMVTIEVSENRDGKWTRVAEPSVVVEEGQEGTYIAGGEVRDPLTNRMLPYGIEARCKVLETDAGTLRLSMSITCGDLDTQGESSFVIREWSMHCVRTFVPGEPVEIDVGANRKARVLIRPVRPKH